MKLIYCPRCQDVVRLREAYRACACGRSGGRYVNGARATYSGEAVPLGIINHSLRRAAMTQAEAGERKAFEAFVMPKDTENFRPASRDS